MTKYNLYQVKAQFFVEYPKLYGKKQNFVNAQYICAISESDGELPLTRFINVIKEEHPRAHFSHCKLGAMHISDGNIEDIVNAEKFLNGCNRKSGFKVLKA